MKTIKRHTRHDSRMQLRGHELRATPVCSLAPAGFTFRHPDSNPGRPGGKRRLELRTPAEAAWHPWNLRTSENSATGTRTRVARVRAEYPNQLDYSGVEVD